MNRVYNNGDLNDLYISEGCLPTDIRKTIRSEVCVSEEVFIDIQLPLLTDSKEMYFIKNPKARILAVNESENSVMVEFFTDEISMYIESRPVVYSMNNIIKDSTIPYDGW